MPGMEGADRDRGRLLPESDVRRRSRDRPGSRPLQQHGQCQLRRRGVRIYEVPISYVPRTELEGKKIRVVHDGLRAAWTLLKYRFVR